MHCFNYKACGTHSTLNLHGSCTRAWLSRDDAKQELQGNVLGRMFPSLVSRFYNLPKTCIHELPVPTRLSPPSPVGFYQQWSVYLHLIHNQTWSELFYGWRKYSEAVCQYDWLNLKSVSLINFCPWWISRIIRFCSECFIKMFSRTRTAWGS